MSKTLGHSSIKVTEAYLASFDEKAVGDTLDSMFKKLGESEDKKSKLINEEMDKMKHLLGYKKKTQ